MQHKQDIDKKILELDISKPTLCIFILAVVSFFMHLVLHNYNGLKKKHLETSFYTGHINQSTNATLQDIDNALTSSNFGQATQNTTTHPLSLVDPVKSTKKRSMQSKKIGNVLVISILKDDTLIDALKEAKISKASSIAQAIDRKYKLYNIKPGDVLQIQDLSKDSSVNLKLILLNKVEISIKEIRRKYVVLVKDLVKKQKINIETEIKRSIINLSKESIQKANLSQDLKRDLAMIVQLLKYENINPSKLEVIYEKNSNKNAKLLYVNTENLKIYKYRDKTGVTHYVKQNGILLSRESKYKPIPAGNFRLSYPISNPVIGSGFGMRNHPIIGRQRMHKGIDFRACKGTPIQAPADGIITEITTGRGFGKHVRMRHNGIYTTLYAHLDNFAKNKKVGMRIKQGEVIGYVGKTGMASGEHLHFEVHENGRPVNPMRLLSNTRKVNNTSQIKTLNKKQLVAFRNHQSEVENKLKSL